MSNSDALGRTNKPWSVSEWETTFIDQGLTFQRRLSKIIGGRFLIVLILGNRRKMTVIELSAEGRSVISKLWLGASSAHLCLTWCLTEIWFSCSSNRGSMDWMSARISHLLCAPSPIFFLKPFTNRFWFALGTQRETHSLTRLVEKSLNIMSLVNNIKKNPLPDSELTCI